MAEKFRDQLMVGAPTNADHAVLQRLSAQLRARKVIVKLYLRHLSGQQQLDVRGPVATGRVQCGCA